MARQTGPLCKLCRREGIKLFLKGERCNKKSCAIEKKAFPPGQHGMVRAKASEYRLRLREKQRARKIYGILERQFKRYFEIAEQQSGSTGENLLRLLESRFDNIIFRMGFTLSRTTARQLTRHGHFIINGMKVNIPSRLLKAGDIITVNEKSRDIPPIKNAVERTKAAGNIPSWLEVNQDNFTGKVINLPGKEELVSQLQEQLIVEYYSGK